MRFGIPPTQLDACSMPGKVRLLANLNAVALAWVDGARAYPPTKHRRAGCLQRTTTTQTRRQATTTAKTRQRANTTHPQPQSIRNPAKHLANHTPPPLIFIFEI
jgi:hypothetical protein